MLGRFFQNDKGKKCSNVSGWRLKDPNVTRLILVVSIVEKVARESWHTEPLLGDGRWANGGSGEMIQELFMVHLNPSSNTVSDHHGWSSVLATWDPLKTQKQRKDFFSWMGHIRDSWDEIWLAQILMQFQTLVHGLDYPLAFILMSFISSGPSAKAGSHQ
jgi:hypothetical protein